MCISSEESNNAERTPMRIGFVEFNNLDAGGGTESWLEAIVDRLRTKHEISILTGNGSEHNTQLKARMIGLGVSVHELRTIWTTSFFAPSDLPKLRFFVSTCDVVYFIWSPGGLEILTLVATKLARAPLVVGHHQPISGDEVDDQGPFNRRVWNAVFGFRSRRLLPLASTHHVTNSRTAGLLRKVGNVKFVPYGVDCGQFHPGQKYVQFTVLFLGRLERQKGADLLPSIVQSLTKQVPDARLVVAGSGSLSRSLEAALKGTPTVLSGYVRGEKKLELLRRSHVLIIPSRYESFALVGLEAMASGTPVVSFDVSGPTDYITNGANGYVVADVDGLVRAVKGLWLAWKAIAPYQTIQSAATSTASRYQLDDVAMRMERVLIDATTSPGLKMSSR